MPPPGPSVHQTRRVADPGNTNLGDPARSKKATETLSQFVARVLDQLSLSAWLPSAALVMLVYVIFSLGSVIDADPPLCGTEKDPKTCSAARAVGLALEKISNVSLGGALLLLVAVVVLTMLTQAFAFESIRFLEGYWGTSRTMGRFAKGRCARWATKRDELDKAHGDLAEKAWEGARTAISAQQAARKELGKTVVYTPAMLEFFEAAMFQRVSTAGELGPTEIERAMGIPWQQHADPDVLRQMVTVDKARQDFPLARRTLPTRFGNVMRHYEDATGVTEDLEPYVQDNFDRLPPSLQSSHDEERTRLDLYCTMVFVLPFVGMIALARYLPDHWGYALAWIITCGVATWVTYASAVASARAYGSVLGSVVRCLHAQDNAPQASVQENPSEQPEHTTLA